jgi:hypothetical protein
VLSDASRLDAIAALAQQYQRLAIAAHIIFNPVLRASTALMGTSRAMQHAIHPDPPSSALERTSDEVPTLNPVHGANLPHPPSRAFHRLTFINSLFYLGGLQLMGLNNLDSCRDEWICPECLVRLITESPDRWGMTEWRGLRLRGIHSQLVYAQHMPAPLMYSDDSRQKYSCTICWELGHQIPAPMSPSELAQHLTWHINSGV